MQLLDSRASQMTPNQALSPYTLITLVGATLTIGNSISLPNATLTMLLAKHKPGLNRLKSKRSTKHPSHEKSLTTALDRWQEAMHNMSQFNLLRQIVLYLLCWGEAAQVRFAPECLCFIFKCADDYYRSPESQNRVEPIPEGLYLQAVTKLLCGFIRDQGYEVVDGKFVERERDHQAMIGYDDVNQLFWYLEGYCKDYAKRQGLLTLLPFFYEKGI